MADLPDPTPARPDPAGAEHAQPRAETEQAVQAGDPKPGLQRQIDLPRFSPPARGAARAPGPGAPPAGRPGWATGVVSFPALLGGLIVAFAGTLGLAAVGGWGGAIACALVIVVMVSLVVSWSE